jgi:YgiT-type zinc finger domain-containing protein
MNCVICKHGGTQAGHTTVTLERGQTVLVSRNVPAQVCRLRRGLRLRGDHCPASEGG